jgi:hypothetical protein
MRLVHVAGEYADLVQHCRLCGRVLADDTHAIVVATTRQSPVRKGWATDAHVFENSHGPVTEWGLTDETPNCVAA